jgi:hypothetical protein
MKIETRKHYIANDGSDHDNETDAVFRDYLCTIVDIAMRPLGKRPTESAFTNGERGYIQHTPQSIKEVRASLVRIVYDLGWEWEGLKKSQIPPEEVHPGYFGRLLYGEKQRPLRDAFSRLHNFDFKLSREYGQPYFANHPTECENKEIEPITES